MENVLLVGLSRQTALRRELDIVANNIANLNTTGYKADGATFSEFLYNASDTTAPADSMANVSFVEDRASWHDMSQGTIQQTGNPLDVALDGDGMLVVQSQAGERYTRAGSLQISPTGELVTASGDRVLGDNGPIVLQPTDRNIVITKDGTVKVQEGTSVTSDSTRGKLRIVRFANPQSLQKEGSSMFSAPAGVTPEPAPNINVIQGALEKSNVRSVIEMTRMIEITRMYTEVSNMLQQQNELRRSAIQQLAEVPV